MEKQYILNGCSQNGYQWDGSLYEISPKATVVAGYEWKRDSDGKHTLYK